MFSVSICEKLSPLQPSICGQLLNLVFSQLVVSFPCAWTAIKTESLHWLPWHVFHSKLLKRQRFHQVIHCISGRYLLGVPAADLYYRQPVYPLLGHLFSIFHQHRSWQIFRFLGLIVYTKQADDSVIHSCSIWVPGRRIWSLDRLLICHFVLHTDSDGLMTTSRWSGLINWSWFSQCFWLGQFSFSPDKARPRTARLAVYSW